MSNKLKLLTHFKNERLGDGKINTPEELLNMENEKVWETDPLSALKYERVERRKLMNWVARYTLSFIILGTFIFVLWLLFHGSVNSESRDLINIMIGAYVAVIAKATDYWFKDKDDAEVKELQDLHASNNKVSY